VDKGQFEPDNWEHPPLRPITLYGFIKIFGDNPYGWRMRSILFGALAAPLVYLFARGTTANRKAALLAGLLIATDPLHIVLSRFTHEEIFGSVLFLAAIVLYLWHNKRCSWLILSALFVGCAMATKWYFLPNWLLLYGFAMHEQQNYRKPATALFITSTYLFVPLTVFMMSYFMWFGRGYSFYEFLEFIQSAYYSLQAGTIDNFMNGLFFLTHVSAREWFLLPITVGQGTYLGDGKGEFILFTNNLPIWIFTIPALLGACIVAVKTKSMKTAMPALFFCGAYALLVHVKRPILLYSAAPLLPFTFTLIAYGVTRIAERYSMKIFYLAVVFMLGWNLYLYPLVTAKKIPVVFYRTILNNNDIQIH
jgi:dolichyl-phosphate-mannose--protein O-mannosyl transferase